MKKILYLLAFLITFGAFGQTTNHRHKVKLTEAGALELTVPDSLLSFASDNQIRWTKLTDVATKLNPLLSISDLQEVTDSGAITNNNITIDNSGVGSLFLGDQGANINAQDAGNDILIDALTSSGSVSLISFDGIFLTNGVIKLNLQDNGIFMNTVSGGSPVNAVRLLTTNITAERVINFPDQPGTLALTSDLTVTAQTGTALDLGFNRLTPYNIASASNATTYTTTNIVIGGAVKCLINAATEPVVTGATKISSPTFQANTDMFMIVYTDDGTNVEFYFLLK